MDNEIIIELPETLDITNIHRVFGQVQDIITEHNTYDKFVLETTGLIRVEPDGIVGLAALMKLIEVKKLAKSQFVRHNTNLSDAELYLARMQFFKKLDFEIKYPYRMHDSSGRFCEMLEVLNEDDVKAASNKIQRILQNKFGDKIQKIQAGLAMAIEEVMFNVFHHSETEIPSYVCAQSYSGRIVIAIVDAGIGFKEHLSRTYNHIKSDNQAIRFALEKYISGNQQPQKRSNTGIGLYGTKRLILKNKGKMCIYTGKGNYELINGKETYYDVSNFTWKGTLISLTFMLNNPISVLDFYDDDINNDNQEFNSLFV